ncbi:MAG: hypothetical protein WC350_05950 [Candidatus Micrarchaeia archaeon]|jgi:hypothetical protein
MMPEEVRNRTGLDDFRRVPENFTSKIIELDEVRALGDKEITATDYFFESSRINAMMKTCGQETDLKVDEVFAELEAMEQNLNEIGADTVTDLTWEAREQLRRLRVSIVVMFCFSLLGMDINEQHHKRLDSLLRRVKDNAKQAVMEDVQKATPELMEKLLEIMDLGRMKPKEVMDQAQKRMASRGAYGEK